MGSISDNSDYKNSSLCVQSFPIILKEERTESMAALENLPVFGSLADSESNAPEEWGVRPTLRQYSLSHQEPTQRLFCKNNNDKTQISLDRRIRTLVLASLSSERSTS